MRFEPESIHGANNGLDVARALLEKIKEQFPWISYGDLWTLAGVAAVQEMAGPKIPWRPGRIDGFAKDATPDGRLPDAAQGASHVRNIFYRMGYDTFLPLEHLLIALIMLCSASMTRRLSLWSAHTPSADVTPLVPASKVPGPSPPLPSPTISINFCLMRSKDGLFLLVGYRSHGRPRWVWKKWNGPKQLQDKKTGTLMMLP